MHSMWVYACKGVDGQKRGSEGWTGYRENARVPELRNDVTRSMCLGRQLWQQGYGNNEGG